MDNWAPQSPDLSSYYSADAEPVHPQHQGYQGYRASLSHATPHDTPPLPGASLQQSQQSPVPPQPLYVPHGIKQEESMQDADYVPDASAMPHMSEIGNAPTGGSMLPPNADSIIIKNHFPVARIKRIMQADDDVGKVAQVTPVVVSKALELFMISLVTKAAAEAKQRNSKRVGAVHLKQAITKNEQFDFLNDIVSKVADAPEKSEPDAMDMDGKKKKAPRGRRKKVDDDDDF
ncbi:hypothetical protein N0V94_008084 [Neodidymelliopsis sp. IMI 364377]|nr:hypothetical protein N0V94_008084 [Neodidymelliopsis sp. IMI 364377]